MATGKRRLREVIDAGRDLFGAEDVNSSTMTGWSTQYVNWWTQNYTSTHPYAYYQYLYYYIYVVDSNGDKPHQDGVTLALATSHGGASGTGSANYTATYGGVGLKHYTHTVQSMKTPWVSHATEYDASSPSHNISGCGNGSGTYATANISMGDLRGTQYHDDTSYFHVTSTGTQEYLYNSGEISIGDAS